MKKRSGYLYQKKPGGIWYVRTMVEGKTFIKSTGTKLKRTAEKRRDEIMRPFTLNDQADVLTEMVHKLEDTKTAAAKANEAPPLAIEKAFIQYIKSPERLDSGDSTLDRYGSIWKRFSKWILENHPECETLDQISQKTAAVYIENLKAAKISASTFNQHKNFLKLLWSVLLSDKPNPWQKIKSRRLTSLATRKQALNSSQFENLLTAVENDQDYHDLFILLAWTGLRLVDAVNMLWSAVDFKKNVLTLAPKKTERRQGKVIYIPIFPAACEVLNSRQSGKVLNPAGYVFPELAEIYQRDRGAISKQITKAFKRAGMDTKADRAELKRAVVVYGAHSLRHFFVTVATAAGMPSAMIKSITGHSTDSMLEHYQQIGVDLASELALRISGTGLPSLPDAAETNLDSIMTMLDQLNSAELATVSKRVKELVKSKNALPAAKLVSKSGKS